MPIREGLGFSPLHILKQPTSPPHQLTHQNKRQLFSSENENAPQHWQIRILPRDECKPASCSCWKVWQMPSFNKLEQFYLSVFLSFIYKLKWKEKDLNTEQGTGTFFWKRKQGNKPNASQIPRTVIVSETEAGKQAKSCQLVVRLKGTEESSVCVTERAVLFLHPQKGPELHCSWGRAEGPELTHKDTHSVELPPL